MKNGWRTVLYDTIGIACIVLGVMLFPLPLPFGIIFFALGVIILAVENRSVRTLVCTVRKHNPTLNRAIEKSRKHLPGFVQSVIDMTDPKQ